MAVDFSETKLKIQDRSSIINGHAAPYIPFFARLSLERFKKNRTFRVGCGGSIISLKHVLTAAHCFRYIS